MNYQELGFEVLKRRRQLKLSQWKLAEKSGVSRNYISMIERGEAENISVQVLNDLAKALGADGAAWYRLLTGEEES